MMSNRSIKMARILMPWQRLTNFLKSSFAQGQTDMTRELWALVVFACSLILLLSLASFNELDVTKKWGFDFHNWLGPVGAWMSLKLLGTFGFFAYLVPFLGFCLSGCTFLKKTSLSPRFFGMLAVLFGFWPLLSFVVHAVFKNTFLIGGTFGKGMANTIIFVAGKGGLFIVTLTSLLCGLIVVMGRPFLLEIFQHLLNKKPKKTKDLITILPVVEANPLKKAEPLFNEQQPLKNENLVVLKPLLSSPITDHPNSDIHIVERDVRAHLSALKSAEKEKSKKEFSFTLPPLNLLDYDAPDHITLDSHVLKKEADKLQRAFLQFGIEGKIREIRPGPVVTNYEFVPAPGIKLSRIAALSDDIAMAMSAVQVRIVTPIPGKGAVGIEVPNEKREIVYLKEIVADSRYRQVSHKLCMAIGKDVEGNPYFMNLAEMPHVLIAGTTGSGKSVSVNAMICSILYRATPNDVRFLMIDPKMLELSIYSGIPHLLLPPIIDAKKAINALKWAVKEMDQRYALMKEAAVRDIAAYNDKLKTTDSAALKEIDGRKHEHLPFIVIVVDEYADLLAVAGKEVESLIMRLAQKARASGIHVMLATQRPSVDVITGVIKANFPVRMGFRLASSHDSKTIINKTGAEKLLGRGDVLIMPPGSSDLFRIHGAFISEKELSRVVKFLTEQKDPDYREDIAEFMEEEDVEVLLDDTKSDLDEKFSEALAIVTEHHKCSTSFIQRHLSVGYNRAARIVEQMEKKGLVGPVLNARGEREIFINDNKRMV